MPSYEETIEVEVPRESVHYVGAAGLGREPVERRDGVPDERTAALDLPLRSPSVGRNRAHAVLHPAHRVELMRRDHRAEGSNSGRVVDRCRRDHPATLIGPVR